MKTPALALILSLCALPARAAPPRPTLTAVHSISAIPGSSPTTVQAMIHAYGVESSGAVHSHFSRALQSSRNQRPAQAVAAASQAGTVLGISAQQVIVVPRTKRGGDLEPVVYFITQNRQVIRIGFDHRLKQPAAQLLGRDALCGARFGDDAVAFATSGNEIWVRETDGTVKTVLHAGDLDPQTHGAIQALQPLDASGNEWVVLTQNITGHHLMGAGYALKRIRLRPTLQVLGNATLPMNMGFVGAMRPINVGHGSRIDIALVSHNLIADGRGAWVMVRGAVMGFAPTGGNVPPNGWHGLYFDFRTNHFSVHMPLKNDGDGDVIDFLDIDGDDLVYRKGEAYLRQTKGDAAPGETWASHFNALPLAKSQLSVAHPRTGMGWLPGPQGAVQAAPPPPPTAAELRAAHSFLRAEISAIGMWRHIDGKQRVAIETLVRAINLTRNLKRHLTAALSADHSTPAMAPFRDGQGRLMVQVKEGTSATGYNDYLSLGHWVSETTPIDIDVFTSAVATLLSNRCADDLGEKGNNP